MLYHGSRHNGVVPKRREANGKAVRGVVSGQERVCCRAEIQVEHGGGGRGNEVSVIESRRTSNLRQMVINDT